MVMKISLENNFITKNLTDLINNKPLSSNGIDLIIICGDIAYDDGM